LMGVVPSGAYLAKKLLLDSADQSGQWWWTRVLQGGAAFTAAYVVLIALRVLRRPAAPLRDLKPVSMLSQCAALGLALASLALSLVAVWGPLPAELISNPLSPKELGNTLTMFALGALLAAGLARRPLLAPGAGPRSGVALLGLAFEQGDRFVRRWPSAMLALLLIAGTFGGLLIRG
jgi:NADH:ubiquinone oxidoreductase subunit 5 (subunit L)/multisubunit Na+/H+ antiporter MnhA subunit